LRNSFDEAIETREILTYENFAENLKVKVDGLIDLTTTTTADTKRRAKV
jgi:hypothetical protein